MPHTFEAHHTFLRS